MWKRVGAIVVGWLASNLLWGLVAPGVGAVAGAALTAFVHIGEPWRAFFFVGVLLIGSGLMVGVVRPLVQPHIPHASTPALPLAPTVTTKGEWAAKERERRGRVAIHEVTSTLEDLRARLLDSWLYDRASYRGYQGAWPENRDLLAEEARYDKAVRATERAFQAVARANPDQRSSQIAVDRIDEALRELEAAL